MKLYLKTVKNLKKQNPSVTKASSSLKGSSQERKALKQQQDESFEKGLKADRQKEEIKQQKAQEEERIKNVKKTCALRTPPEPSKTDQTGILV